MDAAVFLVALTAYAGLGLSAVALSKDRDLRWLRALVAVVASAHVFGVWAFRFEWQLEQAVRNGWGGFLLFHSALLMIVAAAFVSRVASRWLTYAAFVVVSLGASGAVLKYAYLTAYRLPVFAIAVAGSVTVMVVHLRARRTPAV